MPRRKDNSKNTEILRIRISTELKQQCNDARLAGAHSRMAESAFVGYLIEIGLKRYAKSILPLERGEEEAPRRAADSTGGEQKSIPLEALG
ncbi:hypothetical protein FACS1894137_10250 [Spirochaetia bacterium]|nr:hypothetical protein FACS1894137_10250 [Spirochaetia bacterium]